tara:strand:- start:939 stop:1775 length:837 start_codon:yes stop_codon:yes gene_type:complete
MWVYLNGQILEEDQAFISPLDRGFTFGDGVYEVIPSYNGRLFLFDDHLKRLKTSLEKTFIPLTDDIKNLHKILFKLQQKNQFSNQSFYVQVTRGVDRVRVHAADEKMEPTIFITSQELQDNPFRINPSKEGLTVRLEEDIRWHRCDIKTIALLGNTLAINDPTKSMVDEIIFHKDGIINEGSKANIFVFYKGQILTPSLHQNILPGITRSFIIEELKKKDIEILETEITIEMLLSSEEVWLSSSTKEVQPVSKINENILPKKKPEDSMWYKALECFGN